LIVPALGEIAWRIRRVLNRLGVDVVPFGYSRHPIARRQHLFQQYGIDTVIDVGANGGQYGMFLRRVGYRGRIISFEPLSSAFAALKQTAADDPSWEINNLGIGDREGDATLNVSDNSESSSLLRMLPSHLESFPGSGYVATETITLTRLDRVLAGLAPTAGTFVKVDTQGYEMPVIESAGDALARVRGVQLEMSIVPLYEGERLMPEMVTYMAGKGFRLMSLEPGPGDSRTGQLLQLDGLFFRTDR
jgi:FkbM family methyltransferase